MLARVNFTVYVFQELFFLRPKLLLGQFLQNKLRLVPNYVLHKELHGKWHEIAAILNDNRKYYTYPHNEMGKKWRHGYHWDLQF